MKYQFIYLNVATVCLNELDSVCLNGWGPGQGKPFRRSLKYLFVYLKVRRNVCFPHKINTNSRYPTCLPYGLISLYTLASY